MVKFVKTTVIAVIILMLSSGAIFAQKVRPDFQKRMPVMKQQTVTSVEKQKVQSFANRGEVIYSEDFENTPYFELPEGWERFTDWDPLDPYDAEDYSIWIVVKDDVDVSPPNEDPGNVAGIGGFILPHTGVQFLVMSWVATGGNAMSITSGFDLVAGYEYTVSFWLDMPGYTPYKEVNGLKVTIGQTPTPEGMEDATVVYEFKGEVYYYEDGVYDYAEITYTFVPKTSGTYYLCFKDITDDPDEMGIGLYIAIDDILITLDGEAPEICDPVVNLAVEYNDNCEAVLTWETPTGSDLFDIYRNNILIAEGITEITYTDVEVDSANTNVWKVIVVCENSESVGVTVSSEPCNSGISARSCKISIYPNPAKNLVYIDGAEVVKVEVYNMFGQLVDTQNGMIKTIDVSKYNVGTYMFKTYDINNNTVFSKITVTK